MSKFFARVCPSLVAFAALAIGGPDLIAQDVAEDLGGILTSSPAATTTRYSIGPIDFRQNVFYRGQNGHLWQRAWDTRNGWGQEEDLGGYLDSDPAAVTSTPGNPINTAATHDRIDVFYASYTNSARPAPLLAQRRLWQRTWTRQEGWQPARDLGVSVAWGPTACSNYSDRIDVFYVSPGAPRRASTLQQITGQFDPGSSGTRWGTAGAVESGDGASILPKSAPSAIRSNDGSVHVFYRGQNDHLKQVWWNPNGSNWNLRRRGFWMPEEDLGGLLTTAPSAATSFLPLTSEHIDVFYVGRNGRLWSRHWEAQPGWGQESGSGAVLTSAPNAVSTSLYTNNGWLHRTDVYFVGQDGHLKHLWITN